ncbi:uncharacterized protein LOC132554067 [Ylistrum balloti]|uniref:uncharacterized protein LOC132554067 n=1 Tax=Ylistrum balloti TaxID=509963 RepID=UPI002905D894|nr:uncharacterized protein LOC132554067 [Ylistrum balloti]
MSARILLFCVVVLVSTSSTISQSLRRRASDLDLQRLLLSSLIDKPDRPDRPDRRDLTDSSDIKIYTIRANNPIIIRRAPSRGGFLSRGLLPSGLTSGGLSSSGLFSRGLSSRGLSLGGLSSNDLSSNGLLSSDIGTQFRTLDLLGRYSVDTNATQAGNTRPYHPGMS